MQSVTPPPTQQGKPDPTNSDMMMKRFQEDMVGILDGRSRAHFDDLANYFHSKIRICTCFEPGRSLSVPEFQHVLTFISGYYQHLTVRIVSDLYGIIGFTGS